MISLLTHPIQSSILSSMNHIKKSFLSILGISCLIVAISFVLATFVGCDQKGDKTTDSNVKKEEQAASRTEMGSPIHDRFYTFRHDNHLFIARNGSGSGTPLHHPDCRCGRR